MMNYQARRRALAAQLPAGALAMIPAAKEVLRNGDSHYRFRQASDFYYLTGFNEPDAVLLITAGTQSKSILFNRPNHPAQERWTGPRLGQDAAVEALQVDAAFPIDEFETRLPALLLDIETVYYPMPDGAGMLHTLQTAWGTRATDASADLTPLLSEQRLIKDDAEIKAMQAAARLSVMAHERVMQAAPKAQYEYELEAEFIYALGHAGCRTVAYDAIVAGGARACTLHYTANNQALRQDELLLIDAGAEVDNYASDVTRTYPISGVFTPEQRLIYELVLRAQQAGIACVKPGARWDSIQTVVVEVLTAGLVDLGLLKGQLETLIADKAYTQFYMHSAGHWLGLDVHDVGSYQVAGAARLLQPGMVLTVEPGLYIAKDCEQVDEKWRGIGVRIEDDILVTEMGHENLTEALVKSPDDLERFVRG